MQWAELLGVDLEQEWKSGRLLSQIHRTRTGDGSPTSWKDPRGKCESQTDIDWDTLGLGDLEGHSLLPPPFTPYRARKQLGR